MKTIGLIVWALAFLVASCGAETISDDHLSRSANLIQIEGVPNFRKLSEDLYRSGQPTAKGLRNVKTIGIRTVVDLRWLHSERNEVRDSGLGYEHIHMVVWSPEESQAVRFLQIVSDKERTPVLVHCQHGADRTGVMCAIYRIAVQRWTKEKALKEMIEGGFGFHGIWGNLIQWINKLDIDKIREKAGITENMEPVSVPSMSKAPRYRNDRHTNVNTNFRKEGHLYEHLNLSNR